MLRKLTIIVLFVLSLPLTAARYGVGDIPNVLLADSTQLLSNPDGIVSDSAAREINRLLVDIRRRTSAEVAVVVVGDFGGEYHDEFATALFKAWGIGKKGSDNGVLLFVAKDRHRLTIRTGYGVEGVLPDIVCAHIIRNFITPHFKHNRYNEGLLAGVGEIHRLLTTPEATEELKAKLKNDSDDGSALLFILGFFGIFGLIVWFLMKYSSKGGNSGGSGGNHNNSGGSAPRRIVTPRPRNFTAPHRGGSFGGGSTGGGGASGSW